MSNETSAQSGQAPAADAQQPAQAAAAATQTPATTNAPSPTEDWKPPTREEWERRERELADTRKEAAANRVKAREYDEKLKAEELAKLTETEKAAKRAQEAEATAAQYRERVIASEVKVEALKLGFIDPADALRFLDRNALKLDAEGAPTNAEDLLKELAASRPYLLKPEVLQAAQPAKPPAPSAGAAMNPARSQHQGVQTPLTVEQARSIRLGSGVFGNRAS